MSRQTARLGWRRDIPDHRDFMYAAPHPTVAKLPPYIDLRPLCPPVYDQGQLGSCTANSIAAAIEYMQKREKRPEFTPSRLFIYYNERVMEGDVDQDNGAQIRDGMKSVATLGVCKETDWDYTNQFNTAPPTTCYTEALQYKVLKYSRVVQNLNQMKGCLGSGYPFVFGFTVYDGFMSNAVAQTGYGKMPDPTEQVVGGHAVMAVGYNDNTQHFIIRNSWGDRWGINGYFTLPYAYLLDPNLSSDFWTIKLVEDP